MINTLEELLQDYARYSFMEGTIDENTSMHLVEDAQNYIKALGKENLLSICGVSCSCADKEEKAYQKGWNDGANAAADDISVRI